jgi:hypothetical protein
MDLQAFVGITLATLLGLCFLIILFMYDPVRLLPGRRLTVVWCPLRQQQAAVELLTGPAPQRRARSVRQCSLWRSESASCGAECLSAEPLAAFPGPA